MKRKVPDPSQSYSAFYFLAISPTYFFPFFPFLLLSLWRLAPFSKEKEKIEKRIKKNVGERRKAGGIFYQRRRSQRPKREKKIFRLELSRYIIFLSFFVLPALFPLLSFHISLSFSLIPHARKRAPAEEKGRGEEGKSERDMKESGNLSIVSNRFYSLPELPSFIFLFLLLYFSLYFLFILSARKK